jgi:hypothetical protein
MADSYVSDHGAAGLSGSAPPDSQSARLDIRCQASTWRMLMEETIKIVGLHIVAPDLPPWTEVKLRSGSEEWVASTLSKWAAGLDPCLRVCERCEVFVMIAGLAQSITLMVVREKDPRE